MLLIYTFTHQRRLAAMQGTNQLVGSDRLGVLLKDTDTPRVGSNRLPSGYQTPCSYLLSHLSHPLPFLMDSFCLFFLISSGEVLVRFFS